MGKKWIPLESNPEVLNEFASQLGLDVSQHAFCDVYGLDPELLAMVPQPAMAVILCYPVTPESDAAQRAEDDRIQAESQTLGDVYYMKQTIGNACGTIAVLHGICNNLNTVKIRDESFLKLFYDATAGMTPADRGAFLENPPPGAPDIEAAHQAAASVGDTAAPSAEDDVDLHFVCFTCKDGALYELDGRRKGPVNHGPSSPETLLTDSVEVIKKFIERSNSLSFNMIALTGA